MSLKKITVKSTRASRKEAASTMNSMVDAPGAKPFEGRLIFGAKTVKEIRANLKITQKEFARLLQVELPTIESWEQGRRVPDRSRMAMLVILQRHPKPFLGFLEEAGKVLQPA